MKTKFAFILLAAAGIVFSSCKKNEPNPDPEPETGVTEVKLDKSELILNVGQSEQLTATVLPEDAENKNVTWSSDNESIATVDTEGTVTAVAAGNARITVTTEDGGKKAYCRVMVAEEQISVTGVSLDKTELELKEGETATLTATVMPENATNKNVKWTTNDESVATVDAQGTVTAVAAGSATIVVTTEDGSKTATCAVSVKATSSGSFEITGDTAQGNFLAYSGEVVELTAAATNVKWSSSDETVATVDAQGKVSFIKNVDEETEVTITATADEGTAEVKFTVFHTVFSTFDGGSNVYLEPDSELTVQVKKFAVLEMYTANEFKIPFSSYSYETSDAKVFDILDFGLNNMQGKGIAAGNAVVTVTLASGLELNLNIKVIE